MQLFHFDRSGTQHTPFLDFRIDLHTLIRLILGLSTTKEFILGLDDTVQWTTGSDGRKTGGTLTTIDPTTSLRHIA